VTTIRLPEISPPSVVCVSLSVEISNFPSTIRGDIWARRRVFWFIVYIRLFVDVVVIKTNVRHRSIGRASWRMNALVSNIEWSMHLQVNQIAAARIKLLNGVNVTICMSVSIQVVNIHRMDLLWNRQRLILFTILRGIRSFA
jgi:hypothetical protein